jgi:hypothetical protein
MKTQTRAMFGCVTLLALFSAHHLASAYYDPGVQRWINRDPIEEHGGRNLYSFAANEPVAHFDALGLEIPWPGYPGHPPRHPTGPKGPKPPDALHHYTCKIICVPGGRSTTLTFTYYGQAVPDHGDCCQNAAFIFCACPGDFGWSLAYNNYANCILRKAGQNPWGR